MGNEIIKEYANVDLTVLWKPRTCIHAAECVKALPKVYDPNAKPWINIGNASSEELIAQINKCPSGALSYRMNKEENEPIQNKTEIKVDVMKNGPLLVSGILIVTNNGVTESKSKTTAFCRCGASNNKPYCDGGHSTSGFVG